MVVGNIGQITSMAIRLANNTIGTSIPVLSAEQIDYLMVSIPYLKAVVSVGAGKVRNTIDDFRNRPRRPRLETGPTFKKSKQEQERKRKLWREQQAARIRGTKPRVLEKTLRKEYQRRLAPQTPAEALRKAAGEIKEPIQGPLPHRPEAILARLRAQRLRELKAKRAAKTAPDTGAMAKAEEMKKTAQRLKNIYRIVNGAAGMTLVGLILTFLVMNAQLFFGNLLKVRLIPALSLVEIIIIVILDFIFGLSLLIIIIFIYYLIHPCELAELLPAWASDVARVTCGVVAKVKEAVIGVFK